MGKYRKSHRLPDEPIDLGDALPVFDTPLGKIGLMIGTDHYWPEVPLVMALEGAELILWSNGPEPVPQGYPLEIKLRVRALDNQVTLAAYYPKTIPDKRTDFRQVLMASRRPELYKPIVEKTLADRHSTEETWQAMGRARKD